MIIDLDQARKWYSALPSTRKIATLSPDFVIADAMRDRRLETVFIGYAEGDYFWYQGLHRVPVPGFDLYDLRSPYGYGGECSNASPDFIASAREYYCNWCVENKILLDFTRPHPMLECSCWGEALPSRDTVVILTQEPSQSPSCANMVRKAKGHGLEVFKRDDIPRFAAFYRNGMAEIGAADFYKFNDDYFNALSALDQTHIFACEHNGEWLSAGLFMNGDYSLEYHLSATTEKGKRLGATNLLISYVAGWGMNLGVDTLFLGGGTDDDPENSLLKFKKSFSKLCLKSSPRYMIYRPDIYEEMKRGRDCTRVIFYD